MNTPTHEQYMERARFAGTVLGAKLRNDPITLLAALDQATHSQDRGLLAIYVDIMRDSNAAPVVAGEQRQYHQPLDR